MGTKGRDKKATKAKPGKKKEESKDRYKKIDLYRKTIKRTYKAGAKNIDEDPILSELRKTLNIDDATHTKLKEDVKAELDKLAKIQKESKLQIQKMERQITDFKKKGIEVKNLEALLGKAQEVRKDEDYVSFNIILDEYLVLSKNIARYHNIFKKINNVHIIISKAEKMGANVKNVLVILKKAEDALDKNQFTQASKLTTEARKASIKLRRFRTAKSHIDKFLPVLNQAKKKFDVNESVKLVKNAQKALKKNEYDIVIHSIAHAKKALQSSKRQAQAVEKVKKIHELINKAKAIGADLKPIKPLIKDIEKDLKNKEYNQITKKTASLRKIIEENRKNKTAENKIAEAQNAIAEAKKVGGSVTSANRYLSQAKSAFKKKKYSLVYKNARTAIKQAHDASTNAIRRKASSAISSAKFLIKDVKDFGVDVGIAEELLVQAEEAYKKNDFFAVEKLTQQAEQLAKETFEKKKKEYMKKSIDETLINIKFMLDELDEIGVDTGEIKKMYFKAQDKIKSDELKAAENIVKEAESLAKNSLEDARAKFNVRQAKQGIEDSKLILREAEDLDINISKVEPLLAEAEQLLTEEKYDEVIEKTNELKEKIARLKARVLQSRIKSLIETTETFITKATGDGAKLIEAEKILEEAKVEFEANNFNRADELIRHCEVVAMDEWNLFRTDKLEHSVEDVEKLLAEAEEHGIDISEAKEILKNAVTKVMDKDFEGAEDLIEQAESMAAGDWDQQRKIKAIGSLENLRKMYDELSVSGTTVDEFKELIDKVEEKIDDGDFDSVSEYINRANIISSELLLEEKAQTYLERVQRSREFLSKLESSGISTDELDELVVKSEEAIEQKDFQQYEEVIEDLESRSHELLLERWNDISPTLISSTKEIIDKSRDIGADVEKAEDFLAEAENIMGGEDFDVMSVEELLEKAELEAKHSWIERKTFLAEEAMTSTQSKIDETREMGVDTSEAESLINEVESMFKDEDFDLIDEQLKKVNDIVQSSQREQKSKIVSEAVSSTKALLDETREMGARVDDAEDLLLQAEGMFGEEDYERVEEYVKRAEEAIQNSKIDFMRDETSKLVSTTKAKIEEGREHGADVSEAEDLLRQAEDMLTSDEDFESVEQLVQQSLKYQRVSYYYTKQRKNIKRIILKVLVSY
jgi:hypothetical protein